jgi:hypothetical protein
MSEEDIPIPRPQSSQEMQHCKDPEPEPRTESAPPRLTADDTQLQILQELQALKKKFDDLSLSKNSDNNLDNWKPADIDRYRLKASQTIKEMCDLSNHLVITEDEKFVACLPCTAHFTLPCPGRGWFKINSQEEDEANKQAFYNLRSHVQRHLESEKHKELILDATPKKKQARLDKTGMLVSAIAYENIYNGHSFRDF